MRKYLPFSPDQSFLLPPNPREWLPRDHVVFFLEETVDELNLSAFHQEYEDGPGGPPFDPRVMVRVLLYAYMRGDRSSREVQRLLVEDVSFRVLAGQSVINFRTYCKFRRRHAKAIEGLFVQVLRACQDAGLVKLRHVALDGTKVHANASKRKAMTLARMKEEDEKTRKAVKKWLEESDKIDEEEDAEHGDHDGYSLPPELADKEARRKKIAEIMEKLKQREKEEAKERGRRSDEPRDEAQWNFTDPESRVMPDSADKKHFVQSYNAQVAVDMTAQVIVATTVTNHPIDSPHVPEMLNIMEQNLNGVFPDEMSMDAGYASRENFVNLDARGIDAYVSMSKHKRDRIKEANPVGRPKKTDDPFELMRHKVQTPRGKRKYALRKQIVEPAIGQIKQAMKFRRFLLRGSELVNMEWSLACAAFDLRKLYRARARTG